MSFDLRFRQTLILVLLALFLVNILGCATTPSSRSQDSSGKVQELNREALLHYSKADFEKAVRIWNTALAKNPDSHKTLFNLGLGYFALQQFGKAVDSFSRSLERKPDFTPALINRALTLSQIGDHASGSKDLEKSAELAPKSPLVKFNQGVLAARQTRYEEAIDHYTAALELEPQMAHAWNNRGIVHLEQGDHRQAVSDFTRAIRILDQEASFYFNRAIAWEENSRFDESVTDYSKALHLDPDLAPAYYNRGLLRLNLHMNQKGCQDLENACRLGMCEQFRLLQDQGVCSENGKAFRRSQVEDTVISEKASPMNTFFSTTNSTSGLIETAETDHEPAIAAKPSTGSAGHEQGPKQAPHADPEQDGHSGEGRGAEPAKDPEPEGPVETRTAVQPIEPEKQDLESRPDTTQAEEAGGSAKVSGRSEDAGQTRPVPGESSLSAQDLYSRALHTLRKEKRYTEAREQLVTFISRFPKHTYAPNAYYWLGETYYVLQDYSKAISIFEIGARRFPDHAKAPDCLLKAGLAYLSIEERGKARKQFENLIADYPDSTSSTIARRKMAAME